MRLFDIKGWDQGRPVKRKSWPYAKQTYFTVAEVKDYTACELKELFTAQDWEPITLFGEKKVYLHEYLPLQGMKTEDIVICRVVTPMTWEVFSKGTTFSHLRTVDFNTIRDIDA